jgi:ABC-2 type transport system permease protein
MRKLWVVAAHEYLKITRKRSFLFGTLAMPLFFVVIMALTIVVVVAGEDQRPIGYVDQAGVLQVVTSLPPTEDDGPTPVELLAFADEAQARAALDNGRLQAYYVLPADYLTSHNVQLSYWDRQPNRAGQRRFDNLVRANLASALPADVAARARQGIHLTARSADGHQEVSGQSIVGLFVPFFIGLFFSIVVLSSGTYLLEAVTDEKESRTIEVMATSMTPGHLIGGKALGLMAVALTQIGILLATIVGGVIVGAQFIEALRELSLPWSMLLTLAVFFLPTFALMAGMMLAVGSMVPETRQGQQIAGALNLLFTLPFFFFVVFFSAPNSPLATILTIFPTTSFLTIALRWSMTTIPAWEMIAGWLSITISAVFMVWAASRIFRVGMLRYGQRLDLRSMLRAVRTGAEG